jgi:hypothetical protein
VGRHHFFLIVSSQESERSCICVQGVMYMSARGIDFASVSTIFRLDFGPVPKLSYFFVFHLITIIKKTN